MVLLWSCPILFLGVRWWLLHLLLVQRVIFHLKFWVGNCLHSVMFTVAEWLSQSPFKLQSVNTFDTMVGDFGDIHWTQGILYWKMWFWLSKQQKWTRSCFNSLIFNYLCKSTYTEDERTNVEKFCNIADKGVEIKIDMPTAELFLNICNHCLQRHSKRPSAKEVFNALFYCSVI